METTPNTMTTENAQPGKPEMEKVKRVARRDFNIYSSGILWGLMAGMAMGAYLIFLNMFGGGDIILLNFLKYVFLGAILAWGLSKYRNHNLETSFFQKAMGLGVLTSTVAGLTLLVVSLIMTAINPEWASNQYFITVDSMGDAFATNATLFFEVAVLGGIITFICVQYLKGRDEYVVDNVNS